MSLPSSLLIALLMLSSAAYAGDVSDDKINAIPVIPKNKPRGIAAQSAANSSQQIKEKDGFDTINLKTNGNRAASIFSGLSTKADKPVVHKEGYKRPRIGLVLSGGGARGGAHLGVIKAFERHNIPIDAIVGTSMGAFVGGLYASGMSSLEIDRLLTKVDWTKVITFDYDRTQIPFRRKQLQLAFPGNAKVGVNKENEIVFGTGLFKRQSMLKFLKEKTYNVQDVTDFDDLRIPFRAVASRLEDGQTVVLSKGSLAESIYASLAIPGGFDPIMIDGDVLVDGGVADNLPIDVMREEMDVDYIIAVDISTPYDEHARFDNYLTVMGQLVNILMRKNVDETIADMQGSENEILVTPDLSGYGSLDVDKYSQIIATGELKADEIYNSELSHLSLYESDYYRYLAERPHPKKFVPPVIDKIELENDTYLNDKAILSRLHIKLGKPLDHVELDKDIADIYNLMIFDDVSYKVVEENGLNVLKIITTPSWEINGQIKFAFGFEDNFDGHSDYSVKFEYVKFGLNSYAGEWRTRFNFGQDNLLLTELYQPIDAYEHFYLRPTLFYRNKKVYVSPTILTNYTIETDLDETFTMQAKEYGGSLGLGANITKDLQLEVGGVVKRVNPSANFLVEGNSTLQYVTQSGEASVYNIYANLQFDDLDNAFFPRRGYRAALQYRYSNQYKGEPSTFSQYFFNAAGAYTFGRHTFSPRLKVGSTFDTENFSNSQDFTSYFTLGGLFNLSGLPTNAVTGSNMAFGALIYRYRLSDDGFFGSLLMPLYAGVSIESGAAWYGSDLITNSSDSFSSDMLLYSGSAYIAADTILGPFYLGFGSTELDYYSLYISLGQSF